MRPRLILLAFLAFAFLLAALRPLAEPDEGRYAEAAREMLATGSLLPTQAGQIYPDKPPGAYWCMDAAFLLLGPTAFAARLPALLALAATLFLVLRAACRAPVGTPLLAGLIFVSSPLALVLGQLATLDMLLTLAVAAAILAGHRWLQAGARRTALLAGLALGAGFLVKGPVAWLLPVAVLLVAGLLQRPRPPLRRLLHPLLWGPALLTGLPWYVAAVRAEPDLLDYWLLRETLGRVASDVHGRSQPLWFFPALAVAATLPWLLWLLFRSRPARSHAPPRAEVLLWRTWALLPILLFSIPASKQPGYLAPALPGMALAMGELLAWPGLHLHRALRLALLLLLLEAGVATAFLASPDRSRSTDTFAATLDAAGAADWPGAQLMGWSYGLTFRLRRADLRALGPPPPAWAWALARGRVAVPSTRPARLAAAAAFLARPDPAWVLVHELHHQPALEEELRAALEVASARVWLWSRDRRHLLLANRPPAGSPGAPPYASPDS